MVEGTDKVGDIVADDVVVGVDGFIPGTTYKSPGELLKGHLALQAKFDSQGNELGTIRKEHEGLKGSAETLATILKDNLTKGGGSDSVVADKGKAPTDYDAEIAAVEGEIQKLDPMAGDYQKSLASLVSKSNRLSALSQHEKTLGAAGELFRKELGERDIKSSQERFYGENPTFNTPEMQAKIRDYLSKDKTGMSDPLVAFREIQRDEALITAQTLIAENAELKRLLDLNKGKDETGKVIVKGQGPGLQPIKQSKVTGKDLDIGMKGALDAYNSES
jgi:hypothetical protein